jgi:hypothetical protein
MSRLPSPFGLSRCLRCESLQRLIIIEEKDGPRPLAVCVNPRCKMTERF